jgi:hypothetical protein
MTSSLTEGWHPDPDGVHQFRYHDGSGWTSHVANDGVMTRAALAARPEGGSPLHGTGGQPGGTDTDWNAHLAQEYSAACAAVIEIAQAALTVANDAGAAWNMANMRPQHEISIDSFTHFARGKENEFAPLYQAFQRAVAAARDAGNKLSAQFADPSDAETCLIVSIGLDAYSAVGAAIEYLRVSFPPTALGFREMIPRVNEAVQTTPGFGEPGFGGIIYSDASTSESNHLGS